MTLPRLSSQAPHNGSLAATAPDPILTIDESSMILFVNVAAERVFGYAADEMVGRSLLMLIPERFQERHTAGMQRYVATSRRSIPWRGLKVPIRTSSGAEVPVEISFGEFEWEGRRVFSGFLRDISERVAAESALAAANELLAEQAAELEEQVEEAQSLTEELAQANEDAESRLGAAAISADRATRLLDLSIRLNKPIGAWDVAELILETGMAAVGADAGSFALISEHAAAHAEFEIVATRGFSQKLSAEYERFPLQPGRPMSDAVLSGLPVLVSSREQAEGRYPTVADVGYDGFAAVPILHEGKAIAAMAFSFTKAQEFDGPTDTFLRTVGQLCAQALERARLYDDRDRQTERSSFLAEASRLLSSSLDYEATLKALAETTVPTLADGCAIDIVDEPTLTQWPPTLTRLAVVHADPAVRAFAVSMAERFPVDWNSSTGTPAVLREGKVQFVPLITEEMLAASTRSDAHLSAVRSLRLTSAISVPLLARGLTLGVLTLVTGDSRRRYDEYDVSLAVDLAARAATAIDNARLFREAQRAREGAEEAMARADSANKAKSNFLATMSHEIRTPINAVLGYSELLELQLAGPLNDEQRAQVTRIKASTAHLLTLVNEVLDLAKIESGTLRVDVDESPAVETADAALSLIAAQAAAKGVTMSEHCEGARGATYIGDRDRVRQILANLIGNAVKFTNEGGSVTLSCAVMDQPPPDTTALRSDQRYVAFRVSDTGIGIAADQLNNIFEAFVQADSGDNNPYTRSQSGTGLGLAISRQLAHRMSGDITVQSTPGAGSTFTLFLPASTQPDNVDAA